MYKFLCFCGCVFALYSECMRERDRRENPNRYNGIENIDFLQNQWAQQRMSNLRRDYYLYTQEMGYAYWYQDMDELFQNLEEIKLNGVEGVENQRTNLDDLLTITIHTALFNACWSPAMEQKSACDFVKTIKNRILDRYGPNDSDMKVVLNKLDDILSFEEEDINDQ